MREISFRNDILPLKDKLYRLAFRITLDSAEAEDIVQDTLMRAWEKREEWNRIDSIEAFCLTIARNLAIDRSRKMETQNVELISEREEQLDASTPYDQLTENELLKLVHRLVNELPEKQRSIIQLRDIEGKSYKEIADIMQLPEEQVKVNLFRARQKIKQKYLEIENYGL
ncbi:MAG: RNA polymerase sigma factor [Phocaeicola sp.]|uniref:RNA polymerase sigma factor n=1 Tax=Phocaeicola sp. TaxID=2773926 RepID=UPI003F9F188A